MPLALFLGAPSNMVWFAAITRPLAATLSSQFVGSHWLQNWLTSVGVGYHVCRSLEDFKAAIAEEQERFRAAYMKI